MRDPRLRALVVSAAAACGSGAVLGTIAGSAAAVVLVVPVLALLISVVWHGWRHELLHRRLMAGSRPGRIGHSSVRLLPGNSAAFVAGLRDPHIFCDERLLDALAPDELHAVTLHEQAHQLSRDPLRLVILAAVAPCARRLPGGSAWIERATARREIAADRFALDRGVARRSLAAALLQTVPVPARTAPGFAPATELRLRALLGDPPGLHRPRWPWTVLGAALGGAVCLVLWHQSTTLAASALAVCCP